MNIPDFMNSFDARLHLEATDINPTSLETALAVFESKKHPLKEKISAWEVIIATMPDMPISKKIRAFTHFFVCISKKCKP